MTIKVQMKCAVSDPQGVQQKKKAVIAAENGFIIPLKENSGLFHPDGRIWLLFDRNAAHDLLKHIPDQLKNELSYRLLFENAEVRIVIKGIRSAP